MSSIFSQNVHTLGEFYSMADSEKVVFCDIFLLSSRHYFLEDAT